MSPGRSSTPILWGILKFKWYKIYGVNSTPLLAWATPSPLRTLRPKLPASQFCLPSTATQKLGCPSPSEVGWRFQGWGRPGNGPRPILGNPKWPVWVKDGPWSGWHRTYPMTTTDLTLSATEILEKCPRPHILGPRPSARRPPPATAASRQTPVAHVKRLTARTDAAQAPCCACAHSAVPSAELAGSRCLVHVATKPGAWSGWRAGRGPLGGVMHVVGSAQSLREPGTSGSFRPLVAGLMVGSVYRPSNNDEDSGLDFIVSTNVLPLI